METITFKFVTQKQIDKSIDKLYNKIIKSKTKFTRVVGIERGGLNISVPLAQKLGLPHSGIKISFYAHGGHKPLSTPQVSLRGVRFKKSDNILFVDDLTDSGSTINYLHEKFDYDFKTAVIYWNDNALHAVRPDFYVARKPKAWIVFPWEENETK